MNIFHKVALQGLRRSRTRTLVTVAGVALSAALFTGVATLAVSLQRYMVNGAASKYGSWQVELPAAGPEFAAEAAADGRVQAVTVLQNLGYAPLEGGKNEAKPYLFVSGWDEAAFDALPLTLLSGRMPENSAEVLVPAHLAANGGVRLAAGDTITLALGQRERSGALLSQHDLYAAGEETLTPAQTRTYTVVGICQRPPIEEYAAPGYTLITRADAAAASCAVFITLKSPWQVPAYTKELDGYVLNGKVLIYFGLSGEKTFTILLAAVVVVLAALVVTGSVFLIYNAFNISLNERVHQFGILMSVGATARQLRSMVLFEGLCIGAVGIPLGVLAGLPGVRLVLALAEKNFASALYSGVPLELTVSVPALAAAALIGLATILLSAYIPARRAAALPVMECIRQTGEVKVEAKEVRASRLAQRVLGLEELLALKNFKRSRRRYRSIVLSLVFSMVLFVLASAFGRYLDQIAESTNMVVEQYDIVFSTDEMDEDGLLRLYDQLKAAPDLTVSGYQAQASYPCTIDAEQRSAAFMETFGPFLDTSAGAAAPAGAMLDAVFVDDAAYQRFAQRFAPTETESAGQGETMLLAGYVEGYMYGQDAPMELALPRADGTEAALRVRFVNDYPDLLPRDVRQGTFRGYSLLLIAPYSAKPAFDALGTAQEVLLGMTFQSDSPGRSTAWMQSVLDADGVTADYTLYNLYAIQEQNRSLNLVVDLFAAVFIGMITLIATANVFNTISTNLRLRRRELAMLRSAGLGDRAFGKMLRFECALYGARALAWGLPLSALLSILLYHGMVLGGGQLHFVFPAGSMALASVGVLGVVGVTMLYAAAKLRRENIMDALRDEGM